MRMAKWFLITLAVVAFLSQIDTVMAQSAKLPEVNTRGACLNVKEFVGLIKHESRRMKTGEHLRLIADIPNEKEAREAIAATGYSIVEETRDEGRDLIDFVLEVKK
jgi:TusA-related sulfurtransferase